MKMPYEDIIHLPHPTSRKYKPMTMEARAAQFAPFAALTGHDAAIAETARVTSAQIKLSAEELHILSQKIAYALSFTDAPLLNITYFQPDIQKDGGKYHTIRAKIKKIEQAYNELTLSDNTVIPLTSISDITGEIFNDLEC